MAWGLRGTPTSAAITAGTGSQDVSLPTGTTTGDLVCVAVSGDVNCQNSITTAGYTLPENGTGANPGAHFGYKVMGASPDSVVAIARDAAVLKSCVVMTFSGGLANDILDAAINTAVTDTSNSFDPGSITTVTANALVVIMAHLDDDDSTVSTWPTGYNTWSVTTNTGQTSTTAGSTVALCAKVRATAGLEDPDAIVFSSSDAGTVSCIAFRLTTRHQVNKGDSASAEEVVPPVAEVTGGDVSPLEVNAGDAVSAEHPVIQPRWGDFDSSRASIIAGLISAQGEAAGWNAQVIAALLADLSAVVRTDDNTVRVTLPAVAGYQVTANETVTSNVYAACTQAGTSTVQSDTFTLQADLEVSEADSSSAEDSVTAAVQYALSVSDSVSAEEAAPEAEVEDAEASPVEANVSDEVSSADAVAALVPEMYASIADAVTGVDAISALIPEVYASAADTMSAEDATTVAVQYAAVVSDSVSYEDGEEVAVQYAFSVSDLVSHDDGVTGLADLVLSVSDNADNSDAVSSLVPEMYASVADEVSAEDAAPLAEINEDLSLSAGDSVEHVDAGSALLDYLFAELYDSVTTADSISLLIPEHYLSVSEGLSVADAGEVSLESFGDRNVSVSDEMQASESKDARKISTVFDDEVRKDIILGLISAQDEPLGWNVEVIAILLANPSSVSRESDVKVRVTIPAVENYTISSDETVTGYVPSSALTSGVPITASPTISVNEAISPYCLDRITVSDSATVELYGYLYVNLDDVLQAQDKVLTWGEWSDAEEFYTSLFVGDSASASDSVSADVGNLIAYLSDSVSSIESVSADFDTLLVSISDLLSANDASAANPDPLLSSISDQLSASDGNTVNLDPLIASIEDTIETLEYVDRLVGVYELTPPVYDITSVGDAVSAQLASLNVAVSELVSAVTAVTAQADRMMSVADSITTTESVSSMTDRMAVAGDSASFSTELQIFKHLRTFAVEQAVTVSDAAYALLDELPLGWDVVDMPSRTWTEVTVSSDTAQDGAYTEPAEDGAYAESGPGAHGIPDGAWTDTGRGWTPVFPPELTTHTIVNIPSPP